MILGTSRSAAAGLVINSSVTSAALNTAAGINVTAVDGSSGGAVLVNCSRITADVDNNTMLLSGKPTTHFTCLSSAFSLTNSGTARFCAFVSETEDEYVYQVHAMTLYHAGVLSQDGKQ